MAATGARADFQRARRRHLATHVRRRLTARRPSPTRPLHLGDVAALYWRPARLRPIPLEAIVGTVDATADFDAAFRPATDRVSSRWQSIARAHRDGRALPPVAVIERPDGYYIVDGRHRVSVARALGHRDIDAWASPAPLAPQARPPERDSGALTLDSAIASSDSAAPSRARRDGVGFWAVAVAFAMVMGFTTVPTPLWSLYAQRDHFSSFTVTLVFAAYALAVALSLFLAGHLSDWHGRRRVLMPALALNVLAAVVFLLWPAVPGLLLARVLSGLGVGAVTATATAWLGDLRAGHRQVANGRRAQVVATGANLGGLGLGALISGVLVQWAGHPLSVPFVVSLGALLLAWVALLAAPETRPRRSPRPSYRPQRVSVPAAARGRFFAAALGAFITFAVFGLLTSLAPSFLAGTLHQPSPALAGAVSFTVFATVALAQTLTAARTTRQLLAAAIPALLLGLGLLTIAVWLPTPSFGVFLAGDLVIGVGAGLMFKGAIGTVAEVSSQEHRAEALAGLFLAAYLGLAGPVIGLGALTQTASTRVSLLAFAGLLALGILAATPALLGRGGTHASSQPQPTSP